MPFADTHCHLDFEEFNERRETLLRECDQADIKFIVVPGVSESNWNACLSLANNNCYVSAALGLHPYFISEHKESDLDLLEKALDEYSSKVVAVGEIGLDDTRPEFGRQCDFFDAQLAMAERFSLPVIMHMRRNHGQGLKIVRKHKIKHGVVHAFSGSLQDAQAWIELGMKIGVGGVITYERATKTRRTIAQLPLESLVLETDAPDMAIQGCAKGKGSPLMVLDVFRVLCELRDEPHQMLEKVLWENSRKLFLKEL